jgi:hypothetical protein
MHAVSSANIDKIVAGFVGEKPSWFKNEEWVARHKIPAAALSTEDAVAHFHSADRKAIAVSLVTGVYPTGQARPTVMRVAKVLAMLTHGALVSTLVTALAGSKPAAVVETTTPAVENRASA